MGSEEIFCLESDVDLIKVVIIYKFKGLEYFLVLLFFICSWRELDGNSGVLVSFYEDGVVGWVIELVWCKE